jgi:ATP-dependent helicase YprA (DUF1998 family)
MGPNNLVELGDAELEEIEGFPIKLPSGAEFHVATEDEVKYLSERIQRYLTENVFTNVSDHQDLDKMVIFELFIHRWSQWLSQSCDYYGDPIDSRQLAVQINNASGELRLVKKALGIDKVSRDRTRGEDSTVQYLANLRERAKAFGIVRNNQAAKAIELFQQLNALIGFHDRCDEEERQEFHATEKDIMQWIREVAIPEFEELDKAFRKEQKTWIRDM